MDKPETMAFWVGRLPHWEVVDGRYFITLHLAGALPVRACNYIRRQSEKIKAAIPAPYVRVQRKIFGEMERWLDRTPDRTDLEEPEIAEIISEAIGHREQRGTWTVFEYVIMPNHLHMYLKFDGGRLKRSMEDFKRWTGHEAAKIKPLENGAFWQREWFDHWARSPEEGESILQYIRNNPVKAGLVPEYSRWPHSSWSHDKSI